MKSLDSTATLTVSYIWGEAVKLSSLYFAEKEQIPIFFVKLSSGERYNVYPAAI